MASDWVVSAYLFLNLHTHCIESQVFDSETKRLGYAIGADESRWGQSSRQTSEQENSDGRRMGQDNFRALIREKMCAAVWLTHPLGGVSLIAVLDEELEAWVGAERYERSEGAGITAS